MTRGTYRSRPEPGSVAALVAAFRMSPRYRGWSRLTKQHADRVMDDFRSANARRQVSDITLADIILMRDSLSETPDAANNWLKVMAVVLRYAKRTGFLAENPLADGLEKLPPKRPGGHRTWRDDEVEAFRAHWPVGTLPRLVLELAFGTAASVVDLVQLGWPNVSGNRIRYRRQKTERSKGADETPLIDIPILPELAEALALVPIDRATFLETEFGRLRSQGSLVHKFRLWVAEAGLGGSDRNGRNLTLHGLRKAVGRRLAEAGAATHVIMSWLGHESIASAQVYTKAYDRARAADLGAELLSGTEADRKANSNVRTFAVAAKRKSDDKPLK